VKIEEFDPITQTKDGCTVWKRCGGGVPVVTGPGEVPGRAPDGDAEPNGATGTEGERVTSK
jgi:hypothetical protein